MSCIYKIQFWRWLEFRGHVWRARELESSRRGCRGCFTRKDASCGWQYNVPFPSCVSIFLVFAYASTSTTTIWKASQPVTLAILQRREFTKYFTEKWDSVSKSISEVFLKPYSLFNPDSHPCSWLAVQHCSCKESVTTNTVVIVSSRAFVLSMLKHLMTPLGSSWEIQRLWQGGSTE